MNPHLPISIVDAVLKSLADRSGFDHWWDDLDAEVQLDIVEKLESRVGALLEQEKHIPGQIGTHDREGWRTFQTPGDVCVGCSNPESGLWVAVSECVVALTKYELKRAEINRALET